jgi:hypothetical protein
MKLRFFIYTVLVVVTVSCSGGGGGGDDGRSTETAVRLVHASIDTTPLSLLHNGLLMQSARYNENTTYMLVSNGQAIITIERAMSPGVVTATFEQDLLDDTEYSVFVYGEARDVLRKVIIEDNTIRPEEGLAFVRFLNGYSSNRRVTMYIDGQLVGPSLQLGGVSEYLEVPFGPHSVSFRTSSGQVLGSTDVELLDQSEANFVVSGSSELGVSFVQSYTDLD